MLSQAESFHRTLPLWAYGTPQAPPLEAGTASKVIRFVTTFLAPQQLPLLSLLHFHRHQLPLASVWQGQGQLQSFICVLCVIV